MRGHLLYACVVLQTADDVEPERAAQMLETVMKADLADAGDSDAYAKRLVVTTDASQLADEAQLDTLLNNAERLS